MKHPNPAHLLLLTTLLLANCGVPRESARVAAVNAAANRELPADDAAIRQSLITQADTWTHLTALLLQQEPGGILGVDPEFTRLVAQTAALARRQRDLIAAGQDDPVHNRAVYAQLRDLWQSANRYLNP